MRCLLTLPCEKGSSTRGRYYGLDHSLSYRSSCKRWERVYLLEKRGRNHVLWIAFLGTALRAPLAPMQHYYRANPVLALSPCQPCKGAASLLGPPCGCKERVVLPHTMDCKTPPLLAPAKLSGYISRRWHGVCCALLDRWG